MHTHVAVQAGETKVKKGEVSVEEPSHRVNKTCVLSSFLSVGPSVLSPHPSFLTWFASFVTPTAACSISSVLCRRCFALQSFKTCVCRGGRVRVYMKVMVRDHGFALLMHSSCLWLMLRQHGSPHRDGANMEGPTQFCLALCGNTVRALVSLDVSGARVLHCVMGFF